MTKVKICGLKDPENLAAAIHSGASYIGLVFYPPSPRYIKPTEAAKLIKTIPSHVQTVGLFVNPTDGELDETLKIVSLNMIQLHGRETPKRITEIKNRWDLPIIKAIGIRDKNDVASIESYEPVADMILCDTKVENEVGGTGQSFDWTLLRGRPFLRPWMLSGGLNTHNIHTAVTVIHPDIVDVSSGVERERGVKDGSKIKEFIDTVKSIG